MAKASTKKRSPNAVPLADAKKRVRIWKEERYAVSMAARRLGLTRPTLVSFLQTAYQDGLITEKDWERARAQSESRRSTGAALERSEQKQMGLLLRRAEHAEALLAAHKKRKGLPKARQGSHRGDLARVIIPDSHGSFIDPGASAAFLADLKALDPDEIVMLGDHVDCGGFLAAHHTMGYVAQMEYTYADDIAATNAFLDAIQKNAPKASIYYMHGNHEDRVEKWAVTQQLANGKDADMLRRAFAPEYLLNLKERGIPVFRRSERHGDVQVPGTLRLGKTFFVHDPGPGASPENYARRFGGCVWYGHQHRARSAIIRNVAHDAVGAWCPGTLSVLQPLYCHTSITDWSHGYGIQMVSRSGLFASLLIPIVSGQSMLPGLLKRRG